MTYTPKSCFKLITTGSEKMDQTIVLECQTNTDVDMVNCESCILYKQCKKKPVKKNDVGNLEITNCDNLLQVANNQ